MNRSLLLLSYLFIIISLHSCAELSAGLSNFNQANGSECSVIQCEASVYHEGKYQDGIFVKSTKGKDVKSQEERWVKGKVDYYLRANFGIYYATSPYTEGEYRFTTYCSSYY